MVSERDIVADARELESIHVGFHVAGRVCRTCSTLRALADEVERLRKQQKVHAEMVDDYHGSR